MEKQKAVCKQEMDELLAKCDEDATNKVEAIVKMLNDDHAEKLQEVYDLCMQARENDQKSYEELDADYANKFRQAVDAMDEDHAEKFKSAISAMDMECCRRLESMDAQHAKKFAKAIDALDADHTRKLKVACEAVKAEVKSAAEKKIGELSDQYRRLMTESKSKIAALKKSLAAEKERKIDLLTESVEKYLNYALQTAIPTKKLISEAKYNASQKAIEKITSILKINSILQESKDGIFKDYEDKLAASKSAQDKLVAENVELKSKLEMEEAKLLLESKVAKCTPAEAQFLRTYFSRAKNARVIEEQIEDARNAFRRLHSEKRVDTVERMKKSTIGTSSVVSESKREPAPAKKEEPKKDKVIAESRGSAHGGPHSGYGMDPFINAYSQMLKN